MEGKIESTLHSPDKSDSVDVAIITSIEIERLAVCQVFELSDSDKIRKGTRVYWRGRLELQEGDCYKIVLSQAPDMANINSALLTQDLIRDWNPTAIILVGIAGAIGEEVELGDIVVGSHVLYYERGKKTPNGQQAEPFMYPADATLLSSANSISNSVNFPKRERPDGTVKQPGIHAGVIASGEKVIADDKIHTELEKMHRKILAIEMEGYGFSVAVSQSIPKCHHLIVRGISDRADSSKDQDWQVYAATVAADFTKAFLLDRPIEPDKFKDLYKQERITQIQFIIDKPVEEFDDKTFMSALKDVIGVDIRNVRITAIEDKSTLVQLEGDEFELHKIVSSIRLNFDLQIQFSELTNTRFLVYRQNSFDYKFELFRLKDDEEKDELEKEIYRGIGRHEIYVKESVMQKSLSSARHSYFSGLNIQDSGDTRIEEISRYPRVRSLIPPNASGPFITRSEVIERIKGVLLQDEFPANIGLVGFGGIGKSEIAIHIINELGSNYPFEPFWIYCGERSIDSIISDLEDGLGLLTQANDDLFQRVQIIRSAYVHQPRIIIFAGFNCEVQRRMND